MYTTSTTSTATPIIANTNNFFDSIRIQRETIKTFQKVSLGSFQATTTHTKQNLS